MTRESFTCWAEAADSNRFQLRRSNVFTVNLCGDAGVGKTALLEQTLRRLAGNCRVGVVVGNIAADRDAHRLRHLAHFVMEVHAPELNSTHMQDLLPQMNLERLDLLLIESVDPGSGSSEADLGEDVRVAVLSVAGGDDKAAEFPVRIANANLILINKVDLLPHVAFDRAILMSDIHRLNNAVPVLEVSAATGKGLDLWEDWLRKSLRKSRPTAKPETSHRSEYFVG